MKGLNVAIVDCDYPQHSIIKQKKRDMEALLKELAAQAVRTGRMAEKDGSPPIKIFWWNRPGG